MSATTAPCGATITASPGSKTGQAYDAHTSGCSTCQQIADKLRDELAAIRRGGDRG